jgi:predicted nucleic acid-binding Zn ribbon protein
MPRFDFKCEKCQIVKKDVSFQTMDVEKHTTECEVCHQPMVKYWGASQSSPGAIFKGSGFHCNDYPSGKF